MFIELTLVNPNGFDGKVFVNPDYIHRMWRMSETPPTKESLTKGRYVLRNAEPGEPAWTQVVQDGEAVVDVIETPEEIIALIKNTPVQLSAKEADKKYGLFNDAYNVTDFAKQWLDVRVVNSLGNKDVRTFSALCELSEYDILRFKNIGRKSVKRVNAMLHELGLSLKHDQTGL
jgi:hypothetical protein